MKPKHVNLIASLGISTAASLIIIFFSNLKGWALVIVVVLVLMGGQGFRYFLEHSSWFKAKSGEKRITKKELETEVRDYFDSNPIVAKKFLRMPQMLTTGYMKANRPFSSEYDDWNGFCKNWNVLMTAGHSIGNPCRNAYTSLKMSRLQHGITQLDAISARSGWNG